MTRIWHIWVLISSRNIVTWKKTWLLCHVFSLNLSHMSAIQPYVRSRTQDKKASWWASNDNMEFKVQELDIHWKNELQLAKVREWHFHKLMLSEAAGIFTIVLFETSRSSNRGHCDYAGSKSEDFQCMYEFSLTT